MSDLRGLVLKNRSYRRFREEIAVDKATLMGLVDLARVTASAGNIQPLKYILSWEAEKNARIFKCLAWAGYLSDWNGPMAGERPSAYIVVLHDMEATEKIGCDHGIASQTILLGATEKGLGGCMLAAVNRNRLRTELDIPKRCEIPLVLALGFPKEDVVLEPLDASGNIKYYRDAKKIHHVPKRSIEDIVLD